ncbi:TPA: serpin family protein [Candidatus Poribacteria bacterium]|nr:serpin family protein [Candidatus Poribacteria bacterium]
MKSILLLFIFLTLIILSQCYVHSEESNLTDTVDSKIISANNNFGFNLFKNLIKKSPNNNIFISPISINLALELAYNGANGETQKAMAKVLGLEGIDLDTVNQSNSVLINRYLGIDNKVQIAIANSIWANKGITLNLDFVRRTEELYNARIRNLDFSHPLAVKAINGWISDETNAKISRIVERVNNGAIFYLINALYFKGVWTKEFNKNNTADREFYLINGKKKMIPMMSQTSVVKYYQGKDFEAISLPYGSGKVSMYIFLPNVNSNLSKFINNLNVNNWEKWMSNFSEKELTIVLPKFKVNYDVVLNDTLKELGMEIAFGSEADFSGLCKEKVFIDEVKHKTIMEVNEEGTEAASVTSVEMKMNGTPKFVINRPFFCAIVDNTTGLILFVCYVIDPKPDDIALETPIKKE